MLLYITTGEPHDREARPRHTLPPTVSQLYLLGMVEHARRAVLLDFERGSWVETPDWRFDRQVIRLALYCLERLRIERGSRIGVLGPLTPLWLAAEFAILGLGCVAVGLSETLPDDGLAAALVEAGVRVAFASDPGSAHRLLKLCHTVPKLEAIIAPDEAPQGDAAFLPLGEVLDLGATLDTAERAGAFRAVARSVGPEDPACWHYGPACAEPSRWTHGEAIERIRDRVARWPAQPGDLAYLEGGAVTLAARLAWYALVGDGWTTLALGRPGRSFEDIPGLRPVRILTTPAWLERLRAQVEADGRRRHVGPLGLLGRLSDRRRTRRMVRARLGDRVRWIESLGNVGDELARWLSQAEVGLAPSSSVVSPEASGNRPSEPPAVLPQPGMHGVDTDWPPS